MTESRFRIDSHQHFWTTRRQDYDFLTPDRPTLWRDYLPTDLEPHLVRHGFDASVVVQAAQTEAETDWLLDLVAGVPFVWGVVGWLDFAAPPETFRRALRRLQQRPKFVGLRPMLQELQDDAWIRRPEVLRNLRWVADEGVPFDILVYPRHLPHVVAALEEVPHLHAVLDHLGKPPIASGVLEPWSQWVARLAAFPDVWCKLSGMVTEADWAHWKPEDMMPYVHHVVTVFGADRVMFGSDWPVCLQAATYDQVVELATATLPGTLGPAERSAIFGDNARRFYRLRTPAESIS